MQPPERPLVTAAAVLLLFGSPPEQTGGSVPSNTPGAERVQPWPENPRYWQYKGRPVVLRGGSDDDNLFQWTGARLSQQLDLLAGVGGNYIRNTMSSRDAGNVWPFERLPDGRFDLERLSADYYQRFEGLLREAAERAIVVQVELWDRFDFARDPWQENPYRPASNVNYTVLESGLADEYPNHPGRNENPFFRTIPGHDHNRLLLNYQHAQVDRLLTISLRYDNVLYTMDNETSATAEWGAYWARYVQQKAAGAGVSVYVTEMWDVHDLTHEQHRRTLDHPDLYQFADISQNNHNSGQKHWEGLQWVRGYTAGRPRPLNHVKIYGADRGPYGTDRDAVERFWRGLLGGAGSVRFHRPPSGIGLSELAQANLRSAGLLLGAVDLPEGEPDAGSRLLADREPNEAYVMRRKGRWYAVYFPRPGSVRLDLRAEAGSFRARWLNVLDSRWTPSTAVTVGGWTDLAPPGDGHWVAVLDRE
ncbi:MAG TPA: hypothetical protein VD833_04355 [Vicinamibacterales bacterium]|nr:hypothetical protein [Vicinamibacterales bacterium]